MFRVVLLKFLVIVFLTFTSIFDGYSQSNSTSAETVVHLLDYIARDYPEGVEDGKVVDEEEYMEMIEFSNQAYDLTQAGSFLQEKATDILEDIAHLKALVLDKASPDEVSLLARDIRNKILDLTNLKTAPSIWPDANNGKALYASNCASCHGITGRGDGPLSGELEPAPTNFYDAELMSQVSPFQAYNTIKLGVNGTSMRPFSELNEVQLWDLAFYIKGLQFDDKTKDSNDLRADFEKATSELTLKDVATLSDLELKSKLSKNHSNADTLLKALRLLSPAGENYQNSLGVAKDNLHAALKNYKEGNKTLARTHALTAYLEGIEPVEARLNANDPEFTKRLEHQMLGVRQAIEKDKGIESVEEEIQKALSLLEDADELLKNQKLSYWLTFFLAASIMLREGLEAFLILAVVLALIRTSGVAKALPWLHGGWITAVILGIAGWFLSDYIIQFGGKNREIMEGLIALFAVGVLLFVGFWLHTHSHAKKWKEFIENKIGRYLQKDKMFGLAAFSFMVVFREAFEVILFLQAINLESEPANKSAIGLGVLAAACCIAIMVYLFQKYSKRIPVRQLFLYSSWIIVLLAIILMGKGFHSLQESGWISVTGIPSLFRIAWLGFYPTLETVLAQAALIVVILMTYTINKRRMESVTLKNS